MSETLTRGTAEALQKLVARSIACIKQIDASKIPRRTVYRLNMKSWNGEEFLPTEELDFSYLLPIVLHEFEASSDYDNVVWALDNDPLIDKHLGKMVGTSEETTRIQVYPMLRWFLGEYFRKANGSETIEQQALDSCIKSLESAFVSETVNVDFLSVLCNFKMDPDVIDLGSDVILQGLNCQDVSSLWNSHGGLQQLFPMTGFPLSSPSDISGVLRFRKQYLKQIISGDPPLRKPVLVSTQETANLFATVITGLRLLKSGAVRMGPIFKTPDFPFMTGSTSVLQGAILHRHGEETYSLLQSDIDSLKDVVGALRKISPSSRNAMTTGINRISYASERASAEDALIDIMIALEALVLSGVGAAKYRGELRFRLSLYIARFLAKDESERVRLYKLVREAYDLRSKIVHGDALDDQEKVKVTEISGVARQVAMELLKRTAANEPPIDWDHLALN